MAYRKSYSGYKPSAAPTVAAVRANRNWSEYQKNIFKDVESGIGNTHVEACPGSGKTTTMVEGYFHLPKGTKALACAFAKPIQVELEKRTAGIPNMTVKTSHGLGLAACKKAFPKLNSKTGVDSKGEKLFGYIKAARGDDKETLELRNSIAKAVSLSKGYLATTAKEVDEIIDRHDLDTGTDNRSDFINTVLSVMEATKKDVSRVDFDDMIWFPNVHKLSVEKYDFVGIDEVQDFNAAQINLILSSCTDNGRVMSYGDRRQSIFAFRGADSEAVDNVIARMQSKVLPLTVSYRCAKSIVNLAKELNPLIEASPDAPEGLVEHIKEGKIEELVAPGDFIISRTNAPLVGWCLNLIRAGIPANIKGRDMGASLVSLIKKSGKNDIASFLSWLNDWRDSEVERLTKLQRDASFPQDKAHCLELMCESAKSLQDVKNNIDRLFHDGDDEKDRVILSTVHKAKGLERENVFVLDYTFRAGRGSTEEDNIAYVAYTRAKSNLYLASKDR